MSIVYSFFLRGVKTVSTLVNSLGSRYALFGSNETSVLYLSGTFHSNSNGILASFLMLNFYLLETPM